MIDKWIKTGLRETVLTVLAGGGCFFNSMRTICEVMLLGIYYRDRLRQRKTQRQSSVGAQCCLTVTIHTHKSAAHTHTHTFKEESVQPKSGCLELVSHANTVLLINLLQEDSMCTCVHVFCIHTPAFM